MIDYAKMLEAIELSLARAEQQYRALADTNGDFCVPLKSYCGTLRLPPVSNLNPSRPAGGVVTGRKGE